VTPGSARNAHDCSGRNSPAAAGDKTLREDGDPKKSAAWFARRRATRSRGFGRDGAPGHLSPRHAVPGSGGLPAGTMRWRQRPLSRTPGPTSLGARFRRFIRARAAPTGCPLHATWRRGLRIGRKRVAASCAPGRAGREPPEFSAHTRDPAAPAPDWSAATSPRRAGSASGGGYHLHPDLGLLVLVLGARRPAIDRRVTVGQAIRTS